MGNEYNFKRKKDVPPNNKCIKKKCVLIPSYYGRSVQHTKNLEILPTVDSVIQMCIPH